jgi:hypothetical protein
MKDMLTGLPRDVQAQIMRDAGPLVLGTAKNIARRKAIAAFMLDIGLAYGTYAVVQDGLAKMRGDKDWNDILQGYLDRFNSMMDRVHESPLELTNPFFIPDSLSPTEENEPGKQDRMLTGYNEDGSARYVRVPIGKVGEEFKGWATKPLEMLKNKESTLIRPIIQTFNNDKGFGRKVYDPDDPGIQGALKNVGRIIQNFMEAQLPSEAIKGASKVISGQGDASDAMKAIGPFFGVTFSKGAPGGPVAGIAHDIERRHRAQLAATMPQVRAMLQEGNVDDAVELMQKAKMSEEEIGTAIRLAMNPKAKISEKTISDALQHGTPQEQERLRKAIENPPR